MALSSDIIIPCAYICGSSRTVYTWARQHKQFYHIILSRWFPRRPETFACGLLCIKGGSSVVLYMDVAGVFKAALFLNKERICTSVCFHRGLSASTIYARAAVEIFVKNPVIPLAVNRPTCYNVLYMYRYAGRQACLTSWNVYAILYLARER